ncbi:hypothetical protein Tco_1346629 [Tanacetum coccineum]
MACTSGETTRVLRTGKPPRAQRKMGRVVEFEDALNKDGGKVERESEGRRPLERRVEDNGNLEPSTNSGGNLPPNYMHLLHNAPSFILNCLQPSNGHVPTYVNPNFQPNAGMTYCQPPRYPSHAQGGNPSFRRASAYHPYGGYALQAPMSNYGPTHYGPMYPSRLSSARRTKDAFYLGSCDGKGDPDNYLHLFEGVIRMQKCVVNYKDLKAKFQSHFIQQKKFTKTHLAVHNIKQRDGKSTRAFITRYTDDTLQILGLHKEQRISGFVHGIKTRSLVELLSTDLPTTYKGLMEKT